MAEQATPFFDTALPAIFVLPLGFKGQRVPVLWVNGGDWPSAAQIHHRLSAIGEQAGLFEQSDLHEAYGVAHTFWIYARELHPNDFFLQVALDAPGISQPFLQLPSLRTQCLIRLALDWSCTESLMLYLSESLGCFLRFDAVPTWARELAPLPLDEPGGRMVPRVKQLILSSLPVYFNAAGYAVVKRQFDALHER